MLGEPSLAKYSKREGSNNQYKRFLQTAQNVFYEDSVLYKKILLSRFCIWLLATLIVGGGIFLALMYNWQPFSGSVPKHGYIHNGVLYCDAGYLREGETCVLDASLIEKAENFAIKEINSLRYQWGDMKCKGDEEYVKPYSRIEDLLN